jgi:hypothetical protein
MMINRSGIPRGITQCHVAKKSISFLPAFFVISGGPKDRAR